MAMMNGLLNAINTGAASWIVSDLQDGTDCPYYWVVYSGTGTDVLEEGTRPSMSLAESEVCRVISAFIRNNR